MDLRAGETTVTSERGAFEFRVARPCSPTLRAEIRAPSGQRTWEALSPAPADGETRDLRRLAPVALPVALPVVASGRAVDDGGFPP